MFKRQLNIWLMLIKNSLKGNKEQKKLILSVKLKVLAIFHLIEEIVSHLKYYLKVFHCI